MLTLYTILIPYLVLSGAAGLAVYVFVWALAIIMATPSGRAFVASRSSRSASRRFPHQSLSQGNQS